MGKLNSSRGGDTRHIDPLTILHATKPLILVNTASFSSSASGSACSFQEGLRRLSKFSRKQSDGAVFEVVLLRLAAMIALSFLENSVFFYLDWQSFVLSFKRIVAKNYWIGRNKEIMIVHGRAFSEQTKLRWNCWWQRIEILRRNSNRNFKVSEDCSF